MSQEMFLRKIPENMRPWECNVNGVKYVYPAGTEQNVPAEVAALIDAYWEKQEVDYPETGISFNDLKDRPFYESTEVLFDQRVAFEKVGIDNPVYSWETRGSLPLDYGDEVIVTFEGKTYKETVYGQEGIYAIGNQSTAYGIPFFVSWTPSDNGIFTILGYGPITTDVKIERMVARTIDPKYMPNGGAGVGYESAEVLHNGELKILSADEDDDLFQNLNLDIAVGDTLRVTWVDEEYVCSVASAEEGNDAVVFGNTGLIGGDDTGEPFLIAYLAGTGAMVMAADGQGLYYCKIVKEVVHTIDPKFLPGKVVYYWDSDAQTVTDANGNEITVEQAKKDMFNVVIRDLYDGVFRIPFEITSGDGYVRFDWYTYDGGGQVVIGEQPR